MQTQQRQIFAFLEPPSSKLRKYNYAWSQIFPSDHLSEYAKLFRIVKPNSETWNPICASLVQYPTLMAWCPPSPSLSLSLPPSPSQHTMDGSMTDQYWPRVISWVPGCSQTHLLASGSCEKPATAIQVSSTTVNYYYSNFPNLSALVRQHGPESSVEEPEN